MSATTDIAAQTALTAASAFFVSMLGVEPQAIIWSFVGCVLGVTLAKPSSTLYAIALFIAATLACALLGTVTADTFFSSGKVARNASSVIYGAAFHPLLAAFIGAVPSFIEAFRTFIVRRFLGGGQ